MCTVVLKQSYLNWGLKNQDEVCTAHKRNSDSSLLKILQNICVIRQCLMWIPYDFNFIHISQLVLDVQCSGFSNACVTDLKMATSHWLWYNLSTESLRYKTEYYVQKFSCYRLLTKFFDIAWNTWITFTAWFCCWCFNFSNCLPSVCTSFSLCPQGSEFVPLGSGLPFLGFLFWSFNFTSPWFSGVYVHRF
jgi:hypothetical protein